METQKGSNSCTNLLCTSCLNKSIDNKLHERSSMECEACSEVVLPEMYRDIISYDVFIKWVHARLNGDLQGKKKLLNEVPVPVPVSVEERVKTTKSTNSSSKGKKKGIWVLPRVRISARQHWDSKNTVVIPFSIGNSSFSFHISIRPQSQVNSRPQVKKEKVKSSRRVFTTFEAGESSKSIPVPAPISVPIDEYFYCIICMENKSIDEMFWVTPCSHFFCNSCICNYITSKVEENILSIVCPDPECKDGVLEAEYCKSTIPHSTFERWTYALMEASLGLAKFYCPFSDCSGLLIHESEDEITSSECPHCNRMFCAKCKVPWHGEISCEEFGKLGADERGREDILLRNLAVWSKWQRCPQCKMYVEKIDGCKFISCRCGYCFCYSCGAKMLKSNHYCTSCNS